MNTNSININQTVNVYGNNLGNSSSDSPPAPDPSPIGSFVISYLNFQNLAFTTIATDNLVLGSIDGSSPQIFNFNLISSTLGNITVNVESSAFPGYYLGRSDQGNPNSPVVLIQSSTGVGSNIEWIVPGSGISPDAPIRLIDPPTASVIIPTDNNFTAGQPLQLTPQTGSTQFLILFNP